MGCKQDKSLQITHSIKSLVLSNTFPRKKLSEVNSHEDEVLITVHEGFLQCENLSIALEFPDGRLKLLLTDPYSKELILCLDDNTRWVLTAQTLNTFLLWKLHLSISMRPILIKNFPNCLSCLNSFNLFRKKYNCKCCGGLFCNYCSRFLAQLDFLGYTSEQRLCEKCKPIIIRIKTEEIDTRILRSSSKSFCRNRSDFENPSISSIIRQESSKSILRTGCPSALNTIT